MNGAVLILGKTAAGSNIPVKLGPDGQMLMAAYFDTVIIEAPGVNTVYDSGSVVLTASTANQEIVFNKIATGYALIISNESEFSLTFKLDSGEEIAIGPEEEITVSNQKFLKLYVSNNNAAAVTINFMAAGV